MLKYFTERVVEKKRIWKISYARIMVCVPTGVTEVEKELLKMQQEAGAREVYNGNL